MTRYETYLTLHVLTAIIWLGAGFTFFLLGLKAVRSPNPAEGSTVTDQNEWLVKDHPALVIHKIYPQTGHNVLQDRPDWFVRDAIELLGRVRQRLPR